MRKIKVVMKNVFWFNNPLGKFDNISFVAEEIECENKDVILFGKKNLLLNRPKMTVTLEWEEEETEKTRKLKTLEILKKLI